MSDLIPHDAELRAFILGIAIAFYYVRFRPWPCSPRAAR